MDKIHRIFSILWRHGKRIPRFHNAANILFSCRCSPPVYSPPMSSPFSCSSVGQRTFPTTAFQHRSRHGFQFRDATAISAKIYRSDWTLGLFYAYGRNGPTTSLSRNLRNFRRDFCVYRLSGIYTVSGKPSSRFVFKKLFYIMIFQRLELESIDRLDWVSVEIMVAYIRTHTRVIYIY